VPTRAASPPKPADRAIGNKTPGALLNCVGATSQPTSREVGKI